MLSILKNNKHQQYISRLPRLIQAVEDVEFVFSPARFREQLLQRIASARQRICLVTLYLEQDAGGEAILSALYQAKRRCPALEISVLVDWHRAQRGRIGVESQRTNADWYYQMAQQASQVDIPVYGVPVNTREALGVLHFKGFVIDDGIFYSGASLNDVYLHLGDKYRYDRYHWIGNQQLADVTYHWIQRTLIQSVAVHRLNDPARPDSLEVKNDTRLFRQQLRSVSYQFAGEQATDMLAVTPLVGLGKTSQLNKTITHLLACTEHKLILCTPYFNLPMVLVRRIIHLLRSDKQVEIIVGDKTANDFYIPEDQPFRIIGALPYLYEINLRRFVSRLQYYVDCGQLIVRLWKDADNSYHLKGIWVDKKWLLLTGNNLNPRAWRLDLENAILIHDPQHQLSELSHQELTHIRQHTQVVTNYRQLQRIADYPLKVRKLIRRLRRIRADRLINRIL